SLAREAEQDRLDDGRVVEQLVGEAAPSDERRDDERGHANAVAGEGSRIVVGRVERRRHVIEEAAVLVVGDHEQRLRPLRARRERVVDLQDERLPERDVRRRVVIGRRRPGWRWGKLGSIRETLGSFPAAARWMNVPPKYGGRRCPSNQSTCSSHRRANGYSLSTAQRIGARSCTNAAHETPAT